MRRFFKNLKTAMGLLEMTQKQVAQEAVNRPRQIQSMTSTYTGLIRRDFPDFDANAFLSSAENALRHILNSLENGNFDSKVNYSSHLKRHVEETLEDMKSKGEKWFFDDITIYKSAINRYHRTQGSYEIDVDIAIGYRYSVGVQDLSTPMTQHKYTLKAIYLQNKSLLGEGSLKGHNCPNCGAPIERIMGAARCGYCNTGITEINDRIWLFDSFKRS